MKVIIEIDCDNAAFGETAEEIAIELTRILKETPDKVSSILNSRETGSEDDYDCESDDSYAYHLLHDVNGNCVGSVRVEF